MTSWWLVLETSRTKSKLDAAIDKPSAHRALLRNRAIAAKLGRKGKLSLLFWQTRSHRLAYAETVLVLFNRHQDRQSVILGMGDSSLNSK